MDIDEDTNQEEPTCWRTKAIEQFNLLPVPEGWKDAVAVGSQQAWENYYHDRLRKKDEYRELFGKDT